MGKILELLLPVLNIAADDVVFSGKIDAAELQKRRCEVQCAGDLAVKNNTQAIAMRPEILRASRLGTDVPIISKGVWELTSPINGQNGYGFYGELYGIKPPSSLLGIIFR